MSDPPPPRTLWIAALAASHLVAYLLGIWFPIGSSPGAPTAAARVTPDPPPVVIEGDFPEVQALLSRDTVRIANALAAFDRRWRPGDASILVEAQRFATDRRAIRGISELLAGKLGVDHGRDPDRWYEAIWEQTDPPGGDYAAFQRWFYARQIDESFARYFGPERASTIRLDEIRWGGVRRDGIPPLADPAMLAASEADYLADSDVVFGIALGGEAKAYPKRILAWHEMVKDDIGGRRIAGVYCTLCGSMIGYDATDAAGTRHTLGTSGFLYRSNKLMYDHETYSLWSTLRGEPVVGPLVGQGIRLDTVPVVTTTWGQWRRRHPGTTVLSLQTGHDRNYDEGVAYRDYFATDRLMFTVPRSERLRESGLANKAELLIVRADGNADPAAGTPLAISKRFLARHPVFEERLDRTAFVVVTDPSGASRVYRTDDAAGSPELVSLDGNTVVDADGGRWAMTEESLAAADGTTLPRLPSHEAFWFAWLAQNPETRLID